MLPNTSSSSTTLEGATSPFFHFPWPFLDEELLMSPQHHTLSNAPVPAGEVYGSTNGPPIATTKKSKHEISRKQQQEKKKIQNPGSKKTGKKDRHSKICTAQGIRDRRMRLSLKVARKFFDLQDMLGFDKASKTIEWLLINCKAAIQQLTPLNAACNKHISNGMSFSAASEESEVESEEPCTSGKRKRCKVATNHLARESRDKARARARERTRHKLMIIRGLKLDPKPITQISNQDSGNSSPQADAHLFEEPQASVAVMDELLGITRSSSSSTFSYNNSPDDFAAAGILPEARIEPAPGCYAMTSLGNVQMFTTTQNYDNYRLPSSSTFMDGGQWNPSSIFVRSPTTPVQENPYPNSILMTNALQGILTTPLFTPTTSNATFLGNHSL